MKAQHSEEYFRKYWSELIKKVPGKHYINLEEELADALKIFADLPSEAITILTKAEAERIAAKCTALVKEDMELIKDLEAGKVSLGYTTQSQEVHARHALRERFEFNCLQLADFKKKYLA